MSVLLKLRNTILNAKIRVVNQIPSSCSKLNYRYYGYKPSVYQHSEYFEQHKIHDFSPVEWKPCRLDWKNVQKTFSERTNSTNKYQEGSDEPTTKRIEKCPTRNNS
ncbi:uncharacterized protein LOC126899043 isoform X1 [Daktulosphaira vitifoliae]|uniref:uncharacterized protein LOC126899043 isoform X1 n=1 Tax=Daktulosphaira vitifoliae TaxID=58002 RepID=UPI0021A9E259|nr:uncharacterized protein LOC126899043 isoform X1 [Daktulosphaira vitifoliae]